MKKILNVFIVFLLVLSVFMIMGGTTVQASNYDKFHLVTTNPGEDASTTISVNYHTYSTGSYIEYTLASDTEFTDAKIIRPTEKLWSIQGQKNANESDTFYTKPRYSCSATITNLSPCTKYHYRIVLGSDISAVYNFTTAGYTNNWSFVAFGDFQYQSNSMSHRMISLMEEIASNPPLAVAVGDMTDTSGKESEWTWFLDNPVMQDLIYASAPGDHEYWAQYEKNVATKLFETPCVYNAVFNFPKNGAKEALNSNYYFYYNNVLFISIDTDDSDTVSSTKISQQIKWFRETLPKLAGTYQYLVVFGHKSLNSAYSNDSRVYSTLRPQWTPVFDEFGVDLVISGHDHMYSRTLKLYNGEVINDRGENRYKGTYYMDMGSSGDKTRALEQRILEDGKHADNTPDINALKYSLGAHIEVGENEMVVKVYNQYKQVVDSYTILAKRDPLPIDMSGFNQEELFNDMSISMDSFSTKTGTLTFTNGEMLKYVKAIKVEAGDDVCLDAKINFYTGLNYQLKNMTKLSCKITFTLNNNDTVSKEVNFEYWDQAGIKLKDDERLVLTWLPLVSNLDDYSWIVRCDDKELKTLNSSALANGNCTLPNEYLIGDKTFVIDLMLGDEKVGSYTIEHKGAAEPSLSKEEITLKVNETANLDFDFEYDDLVKVKVGNSSIIHYEDGVITALKEGETDITFTIKNTELSYKCTVKVVSEQVTPEPVSPTPAKSGCGAKAQAELLSLMGLLSLAIIIRKKSFHA